MEETVTEPGAVPTPPIGPTPGPGAVPAPGKPDAARDAALGFISAHAAKFPRLDLAPLDSSKLEGRDAAFAHAIIGAVLTRWLTLRQLVQAKLNQPFDALESHVKSAMLCGAAQIFLMDRVPAYAAINHAVGWSKRKVRPGAGGLVNAVLRRVAELRKEGAPREPYAGGQDEFPMTDGTGLRLTEPVMPENELDRLAAATGHPRHQLEAWTEAHGAQRMRELAMHSLTDAPTVLRWPRGLGFDAAGAGTLAPHERQGFAIFTGSHGDLVSLLAAHPDVWAQDPASAGAVESVRDLEPELIIDMCAGQGTKTRQLADVFPKAKIVASDTDRRRLEILRGVFGPGGSASNTRVKVVKPDDLIDFVGKADLVLLDVPCSNTGVFARRPEAKYRFNRKSIQELTDIQRQIIADSIRLLSDKGNGGAGGAILYSTCSLEPLENQAHVKWAAEWHKLKGSRERLEFPAGGPGKPVAAYSDGAYSVLMARRGL